MANLHRHNSAEGHSGKSTESPDEAPTATPVYALIASCWLSAALLFASNHFDELASMSVITTLIPYIFFCIAAWVTIRDTTVRIVSVAGASSTLAILAIYFIV